MGLLDDAIREHLELKRRRGADTAEVTRQEQEAFGPPRRGELDVAPQATNGAAEHDPGEDLGGHHTEHAPAPAEAPTALHAVEDPPAAHEPPPLDTAVPGPHGDPADQLPHAAHDEHLAHEEHPVVEEHPVAEHRIVPDPGQPTQAFDAADIRAAAGVEPLQRAAEPEPEPPAREPEPEPAAREPEPEPPAREAEPAPPPAQRAAEEDAEDADVLEETPEFLQETPEHDRLWFEQRPPRDFDF